MRIIFIFFTIFSLLTLFSCEGGKNILRSEKSDIPNLFPQKYIESGKDSDKTFMSLNTTRNPDSSLSVTVSGWGIYESGLFLHTSVKDSVLDLSIIGFCGTVPSFTWQNNKLFPGWNRHVRNH